MSFGDFLKGGFKTAAGAVTGDIGMAVDGAAEMAGVIIDKATNLKLYSVIKNTRPSPEIVVWKHETEGFYNKSQLIVAESEEALFVKDGIVVETFKAGKHTLTTENYPIIDTLRKSVTGGESPFACAVYFIDKSHKMELLWGTDNPIQLQDVQYKFVVPVSARGSYSIQIQDSKKFFVKMVGNTYIFTEEAIRQNFKTAFQSIIKTTVAKKIMEYNKTVMEMTAEMQNLSSEMENDLQEKLEEYGIRLVNFYIVEISIPKDDENYKKINEAYTNAYSKKIELDVQGELWNKLTAKELVKDLANNPGSGSAASIGAGIGMGAASAGVFNNISNQLFAPLKDTQINEKKKNIKCSKCGKDVAEDSKFCGNCGEKINQVYTCKNCGKEVSKENNFCDNCGARREE